MQRHVEKAVLNTLPLALLSIKEAVWQLGGGLVHAIASEFTYQSWEPTGEIMLVFMRMPEINYIIRKTGDSLQAAAHTILIKSSDGRVH